MEIKLPELQATFKQLKQDSQAMANPQVRTAVEQLEEMLSELELKSPSAAPDTLFDPHVHMKDLERLMSFIPQIFDASPHREFLLQFLLKGASTYRGMGENERSRRYSEQILTLTTDGRYPKIRAEAFRELGTHQFYQGRLNQAHTNYQQALALFEAENDLGRAASIYNQFGYIAAQQGDYERAKTSHQKALELAQEIAAQGNGHKRLLAGAYNSLGIVASIQANWDVAIDNFEKSIGIYEELELPREGAHVYTNLAMAYVDAEEWEAAGACYAEATTLAEQSGNLLTLSGIYINRAEFLLNITSIDAAQLYCDKALEVFQKSHDSVGIAEAYKLYGCIHRHRGEWEAATDAFTQSIQRYQSCRNPQGEAEGCYEFGLMYQACQDSSQARYFLQRARSLYEQLEATDEIKRVESALAGISVQTRVTGVQGDNAGVTPV
ncbi:tetratricopeptide repeat protein [Candidatus Poribacteria bacterium]|nr:tetratricopeptide repeat protein [Candidatus Poribacteria bacterium]